MERNGRIAGGSLGRWLYRWANLSLRVILPQAYGDRRKLTPEVHRQYLERFPDRWSRGTVLWALARALLGSSAYYDSLWRQRETLRGRPALILWGRADPAFQPSQLARWKEVLPAARVVELNGVGHWPQEEAPERVLEEMRSFLSFDAPASRGPNHGGSRRSGGGPSVCAEATSGPPDPRGKSVRFSPDKEWRGPGVKLSALLVAIAVLGGCSAGSLKTAAPETATVLFVCEHGSAKSVVAAAHFNRLAAERGLRLRAISRGTVPDQEIAPAAVAGLRADGLQPVDAAPAKLVQAELDAAARVVTFCELPADLKSPVPVERWEVPPVSSDYAAARTAMVARIEKLLRDLGADQ